MTGHRIGRLAMAMGAAAFLGACQQGIGLPFTDREPGTETAGAARVPGAADRKVEREVEAPDVFQTTEEGLWDGRPSLGGVWVAHPDATDPERVRIRNLENGKTVIGALFRREREMPGPNIQVSSDAASALSLLAGNPTELAIVALRREELPEPQADAPAPEPDAPRGPEAEPIAAAAAAIKRAESGARAPAEGQTRPAPRPAATAPAPSTIRTPRMAREDVAAPPPGEVDLPPPQTAATAEAAPAPEPAAAPSPGLFGLQKPFVQIGIFTDKANAETTAERLRGSGVPPTVRDQERDGQRFWRVVVGPARTRAERAQLLEQVKGLGYTDAYSVTD